MRLPSLILLLLCPAAFAGNPAFLGSTVPHTTSGGGGSGFTVVDKSSGAGTTGDTVSGTLNSTGANGLIVVIQGSGLTLPTIIDSKGNTWTARTTWFANHLIIFDCLSPTVGTSHTVTAQTVSGCNVYFYAVAKAGGSPTFDSASAGASTGNWTSGGLQSGSITPAGANDFFLSVFGWDFASGTVTVDSSFTTQTPVTNSGGLRLNVAHKIKSSDSTAENPKWTPGSPSGSDAWTIQGAWQ